MLMAKIFLFHNRSLFDKPSSNCCISNLIPEDCLISSKQLNYRIFFKLIMHNSYSLFFEQEGVMSTQILLIQKIDELSLSNSLAGYAFAGKKLMVNPGPLTMGVSLVVQALQVRMLQFLIANKSCNPKRRNEILKIY